MIGLDFLRTESADSPEAAAFIRRNLPDGDFRRILIKPNWVKHQESDHFPTGALVTSSLLIDAVISECLAKYSSLQQIIVGDVPLQTCDWEALVREAQVDRLIEKYRTARCPVRFLDLRRERWSMKEGFMHLESDIQGDPAGYSEIALDARSMLEPISHKAASFRVSDYDPQETISKHRLGFHHYLVARSVLEADLVINMPKMKTHQKSGITGALKNLVGINGSKAYLVHHQKGFPSQGGDEFPENSSRLFYWQARAREVFQKRSRWLFQIARGGWRLIKKLRGIETKGTREALSGNFYVGSGSWHGNDSIWRMVYDLNMIILFGRPEGGELAATPQRQVLCLLDAIVSGEGNGPLQPLPVHTNALVASTNPFLIDFAMARLMGFDFRKIRLLSHFRDFHYQPWVEFNPAEINTTLPILHHFVPAPGYKGHIEVDADNGDAVGALSAS